MPPRSRRQPAVKCHTDTPGLVNPPQRLKTRDSLHVVGICPCLGSRVGPVLVGVQGVVARVEGERGIAILSVSSPGDAPDDGSCNPWLLSRKSPGPVLFQLVVLRDNGFPREPDDKVD